jgi:hypothetical protein
MRLIVFLPMLQRNLEAARAEIEEIEDAVATEATSSEEDALEEDSDTKL